MKKIVCFTLFIFLCFSSLSIADCNCGLELNTDLAIPTGSMKNTKDIGLEFGISGIFATGNPLVNVATGVAYIIFPGKEEIEESEWIIATTKYEDFKPLKIFVGTRIGKNSGLYFLPAVTGNFESEWERMGIDIGVGYLLPILNDNMKLDIGGKFSIFNLIKIHDDEKTMQAMSIRIGVIF